MDMMKEFGGVHNCQGGMMGYCTGSEQNMDMPQMSMPFLENPMTQNPLMYMEYMYTYYKFMCKYLDYLEKCKEYNKKTQE